MASWLQEESGERKGSQKNTLKINMISVLMENIGTKDTSHRHRMHCHLGRHEHTSAPPHTHTHHTNTLTSGYAIQVNLSRYYSGGYKLRHQWHTSTHATYSLSRALEPNFYFISIFLFVSVFLCYLLVISLFLFFLPLISYMTTRCYSHFLVKMSML